MDQSIIDSIRKMVVTGNRMALPEEPITNYPQVKKVLTQAGGVYSKNGFDFKTDAQEIKDRLVGGEKMNDKKKYQQFYTPEPLARRLYKLAEANTDDAFLEPSVGNAAIANIIDEHGHTCTIVELDPLNIAYLRADNWDPVEGNFLGFTPDDLGYFERIVANPPFTKNQDIDHIQHMWKFLKLNGMLVSIAGTSWQHGSQKKHLEFKEWLSRMDAKVDELPPGSFKESRTMIDACVIRIVRKSFDA